MRRAIEGRVTVGIKITSTSKREGHDLSYVIKLGAYGLAGVAAFAVAVALMLTVSSTPTAEAALQSKNAEGNFVPLAGGNAGNGDTVYVQATGTEYIEFEISTTGSASASFTHADADDDGQSIVCQAAGTCDADTADAGVTVAVKIDDDSGKGVVFVKQTQITGTNPTVTTEAINITVAQVPTTLTAKLAATSINAGVGTADPGRTLLNIRLTDENGAGIAGKAITVVSTRALLSRPNDTEDGTDSLMHTVGDEDVTLLGFSSADTGVLAGTVTTTTDANNDTSDDPDTSGFARVAVEGGGAAGISTITVTQGELTRSVELVLHGPVKAIEAAAEQSAIEVGGETFIVVTATDSAGNPVADQQVTVKTKGGITPPAKLDVAVTDNKLVNKDKKGAGKVDKGDIPSCFAHAEVPADAGPPVVVAEFASTGTNTDGQCVIQVSAPNPPGTTDDTARGTHTIVLVANGTGGTGPKGVNEATVEIAVGGAPAAIETDASERIDPSDEITVNITVVDDEAVRVGSVVIEVLQTDGGGLITADAADSTSDGRAKFSYLAPSTPGVVEFLVRTRASRTDGNPSGAVTAQLPIIIAIAEEAVEPVAPPEPPEVVEPVEPVEPETPDAAIVGFNPSAGQSGVVTFTNLSSIDDALGLIGCGDQTGASVSLTLMDGSSAIYAVGAPAFANSGFTDNVEFPIALTGAYVSCP